MSSKTTPSLGLKFLLLIISIASLSMTHIDYLQILSEEDFEMESTESATRPALSSSLDEGSQWQSFNQWMCFSSESVEFSCAEIDYGKSSLPNLSVRGDDNILYELSIDPEPGLKCETILEAWKAIIDKQNGFCAYAAFLQDFGQGHELWIVDAFKTYSGRWSWRTVEAVE